MGTARTRPLRPEPPSPRLVLVIDGHEPPLRSGRLSSLRACNPTRPIGARGLARLRAPAVRRSPNARPTVTPPTTNRLGTVTHHLKPKRHPSSGTRHRHRRSGVTTPRWNGIPSPVRRRILRGPAGALRRSAARQRSPDTPGQPVLPAGRPRHPRRHRGQLSGVVQDDVATLVRRAAPTTPRRAG
jgi:hypothetical protein